MPLYNGTPTVAQLTAGPLAFFGKSPAITQPGTYTAGYTTASRTLGSYTAASRSSAYTAIPVALLDAATGVDLNDLRAAYENLRLITESVVGHHNAVVADLKALGLIG